MPLRKKIPVSQRPPKDQVLYWVESALNRLEAGAPDWAMDCLNKAKQVNGYSEMKQILPLIYEAREKAFSLNPRAADFVVEKILKLVTSK